MPAIQAFLRRIGAELLSGIATAVVPFYGLDARINRHIDGTYTQWSLFVTMPTFGRRYFAGRRMDSQPGIDVGLPI